MIRETITPRANFPKTFNNLGFTFHSLDGLYWNEGACYQLTAHEIDNIQEATQELGEMMLDAVEDVITRGDTPDFGFTNDEAALIEQSWEKHDYGTYARFDLGYDGKNIKMLEYNADTPTCLVESSIAQWNWLEETGRPDQFNFIHEKLEEMFHYYRHDMNIRTMGFAVSQSDTTEDHDNAAYLAEIARSVGININEAYLRANPVTTIDRILVNDYGQIQVDGKVVADALMKLYPWEWMLADDINMCKLLVNGNSHIIEPAWKVLASSKALLPRVWELNRGHKNLLPTFRYSGSVPPIGNYIRKPLMAREGANITKFVAGKQVDISGSTFYSEYDQRGYILQEWFDIPRHDGYMPLIGSWFIMGEACGIGIREEKSDVTGNASLFAPHYFI